MKTIKLDLGVLWCPLNILCWGNQLLWAETDQWLTDWDVICVLKIEVLRVRWNLLPSPADIVPVKEKHSSWTTRPSIPYRKFISIITLWDHYRTCGPSFTKISLCGTWLYSFQMNIKEMIFWDKKQVSKHLRRIQIIQSIFSGYNRIKLKISNRKT